MEPIPKQMPPVPEKIECDQKYLRYLIDQLDISPVGKAQLLHYLLHASAKCRHAKWFYYSMTSCTILLPIFSTLLNKFTTPLLKHTSSILIVLTSISAASLSLFKFHEKWTRYRNYIEKAIADIIDVIYGTEEDKSPSAQEDFIGGVAITEQERRIMQRFNLHNQNHQHLWVQERKRDHTDQTENANLTETENQMNAS